MSMYSLLAHETYSAGYGIGAISRITWEMWSKIGFIILVYSYLPFLKGKDILHRRLPASHILVALFDLYLGGRSGSQAHKSSTCHFILVCESVHLQQQKDAQEPCSCKTISCLEFIHLLLIFSLQYFVFHLPIFYTMQFTLWIFQTISLHLLIYYCKLSCPPTYIHILKS